MAFITDDFLLHSKAAQRLYHEYAERQPILDYHCHLSPADIAADRRFADLFEIWLEGDHYKWRAMRANGVPERFITGDASHRDKFFAWARTVPYTLRNPLYHWTHLELKRYFGIDELLDESTAEHIWERANELLRTPDLRVSGIFHRFDVRAICTTDDPTSDLADHRKIAGSSGKTQVLPTFRPDKAMAIADPQGFQDWTEDLERVSAVDISTFASFLKALEQRHQYFHENGCRLSDHGITRLYLEECSETEASRIFASVLAGTAPTEVEQRRFAGFLMFFFGRLDAAKGWTKQLHLGALRNMSTRAVRTLGPDTGYDGIGDWSQVEALAKYLDALDRDGSLPRTILYNLNPADDYAFATLIGSFQDGSVPGKIQFGSGWWFLDQKEGIQLQLNALSNCGLLSRFVGMLTDSRSFMSYPRHEYFRRILCDLLGQEMEAGELPKDFSFVGGMVQAICYENAAKYFGLTATRAARVVDPRDP